MPFLLPVFALVVAAVLVGPFRRAAIRVVGPLFVAPGLAKWDDPDRRPDTWAEVFGLWRSSRVLRALTNAGFVDNVNSGVRSEELNETLPGAAKDSDHLHGFAFDIDPAGPPGANTARDTAYRIVSFARERRLPVDNVGWYTRTGHVHVSVARWSETPRYSVWSK